MNKFKLKNTKATTSPRKRAKPSQPTIADLSKPFFEPPYEITSSESEKPKEMFKCRLCSKVVNGSKLANLGSHLEHVHPEIYFTKIRPSKKEPLSVKRLRILLNAVEIVTVNGRPFSALLDSGYQAGICNKLQKLRDAGIGINFSNANLHEVKEWLKKVADKVRAKIRKELKKNMVSVMVDIGTKNGRSIFGVSVQWIVDNKLVVRSLGLIELQQRHTGRYLSKVLFDRLHEYGIEKRQVVSITTDNGKNVVKMVRDFNEIDPNCLNTDADDENESRPNLAMVSRSLFPEFIGINEENADEQIHQLLADTTTDEEALDMLFYQEELNDSEALLSSILEDFIVGDQIWDTSGLNCVAHTVQLSTKDALKNINTIHSNVIELSRKVVLFLKKKTTQYEIMEKGFGFRLPRMDCQTRWCSTGIMLSDVLMVKDVIEYFAKEKKEKICQLLYLKWHVLKELVYVLGIPLRATVSLQKQDLTLSDVFGIWLKMKVHLQACINRGTFKTGLPQQLLNCLNDRKQHVFNNEFMSSAIFLDPRYRRFIMNDEALVTTAKQTLIKLWRRINENDDCATINQTENGIEQRVDYFDFHFDEQAELNKLIFNPNGNGTNTAETQNEDIDWQ